MIEKVFSIFATILHTGYHKIFVLRVPGTGTCQSKSVLATRSRLVHIMYLCL